MKLIQLFEENKGQLYNELQALKLPRDREKIQKICIDFSESLWSAKSEYMQNITLPEQDIVKPMLKLIKVLQPAVSIDWNETEKPVFASETEEAKGNLFLSPKEGIAIGATAITAGAISAVIGGGMIAFFVGSIVGVAVGIIIVKILEDKEQQAKQKTATREMQLSLNDIELLVGKTSEAVACVDDLLDMYRYHLRAIEAEFERLKAGFTLPKKYPTLIQWLQEELARDILYEQRKGENAFVNNIDRRMKRVLVAEGYKLIYDFSSEEFKNYFEYRDSDEVRQEELCYPAIIEMKTNSIVKYGVVLIPQKQTKL
jgi:hypothetical protein